MIGALVELLGSSRFLNSVPLGGGGQGELFGDNRSDRRSRNEKRSSLLTGSWRSSDSFSSVEFRIEVAETGASVVIVDTEDGELADVFDIKWDNEALCFAAHWPSTGRLTKYRLLAVDRDAINVRYTYSGQETWLRGQD